MKEATMSASGDPIDSKRGLELEEAIIAAYREGMKLSEIERRFEIGQATLYWVLEKHGVAPNRAKRRARIVNDATLESLMELIQHQNNRILELQHEIETLRAEVARLKGFHLND